MYNAEPSKTRFMTFFRQLSYQPVAISHNLQYLCSPQPEGLPPSTSMQRSSRRDVQARMAESVDALVSNTSGAIRAGSIPAPGTRKWPTDTCRPFLYKIFPTFSPHLPIILQKVFRKRPIFSICFDFFTRYDFASPKINFATIFI